MHEPEPSSASSSSSSRSVAAVAGSALRSWPLWWSGLSTARKALPGAAILAYWGSLAAIGGLRGDHFTVGWAILILSYGGRAPSVLLRFLMPVFLTGIIYDSQRFYSDYIRGRIRVEEPYLFDKRFFGIASASGVLTPNEWFQLNTHWALDLVTGLAYLIFIGVFVITAAWFYFWVSRNGTRLHSAQWVKERREAPMWSFFWVNMLGYSTYYWYPAAPPWYVSLYGLGPADLSAKPNPAGCARFDAMLGTSFFSEFYGRSADVFGAIPSLHVAYPLLAAFFAFKFGTWRVFTVCFYLLMCFSAVYLNHHYVLDILWGSAYSVIVFLLIDQWTERKVSSRRVRLDLPSSA